MFRRPSKGWLWLLLPASAAGFFEWATLFYYEGSYVAPPPGRVTVDELTVPVAAPRKSAEAPVTRRGVLVIDNAHVNAFAEEELDVLISRVVSRGFAVEFMLGREGRFPASPLTTLKQQLRKADSFAVMLPTAAYRDAEIDVVKSFVRKGGKLLLIGDPSRPHQANSLADGFGIQFQSGYLYNVENHYLNFRNILVRDFRPDEVTEGLSVIALYTAGSIRSTGRALALTDTNTLSSVLERLEPFAPLVKSGEGNVLAISDLTFLAPPQNSTLDNDRLISNIADFLTSGERTFDLLDFPHFFQDEVDLLLGHPDLFDIGTRLKGLLADFDVTAEVRSVEDPTRDTVFLGLYQDSLTVAQYLDIAWVRVGGGLRTPFTSDIATEQTALVVLHEGRERRVFLILADNPDGLQSMLGRLESGAFREGLVSEGLGIYRVP